MQLGQVSNDPICSKTSVWGIIWVSQLGSTSLGDISGKMPKNCMKIAKSTFWGQNSWRLMFYVFLCFNG